MTFSVQKIDPARRSGVIVTGLSMATIDDMTIRNELRELWIKEGLIIFRGEVSSEFHVALSKVFGPLTSHPIRESQVEGHPELIDVRFVPDQSVLWNVEGQQLGSWIPWHSDLVYVPRINHGGILRALTIAEDGGRTGFIDQIDAYDALPAALKDEIADLSVMYRMRIGRNGLPYVTRQNFEMIRSSEFIENVRAREDRDFPPVLHPLVFEQPETGRKVLNLSPMYAFHIDGMDNAAGHSLLRRLVDHVTDDRFAYYHKWSLDEMVLWDNWRMLHCSTGIPHTQQRHMQRTTIEGDYGLGRTLAPAEAAVPA